MDQGPAIEAMDLHDHARDYQLEMLEASRKKNIIVAMDTGSGKTLVAILRIREELETRTDTARRVWFLCPTVALAEQQATAIKARLPSYACRVLCGKDGVDAWTNQPIWDAALKGIDIVVATHAVLADALTHAFVRMTNICLLVFDEAHHAANNHPAARVMTFYHPMSDDVERKRPKVLGLTASPVVRKRDSAGLKVLETNLDATVCTPKVHREQLLLHAHRPEMSVASYGGATPLTCPLMHDLEALYNAMDIEQDPYVMRVKEEDPAAYTKAITKRKTYCQDTVKSLCNKSKEVMKDLGPRLCHVYIQTVLQKLMKPRKSDTLYGPSFDQEEEAYLQRLLTPLTTHWSKSDDLDHSPKVYRLLDLLSQHMNHDTRAIIFVKTRAGVFLMKHLLDAHAGLLQCRVGTFVGQSEFSGRGNAIELLDPRAQRTALAELASGEKNILVCTSVAEEGIDIAACNLVICFDPPPNLKSFVQRRGRARMAKSKYILFCPSGADDMLNEWQLLEQRMVEEYMDEMREREEIQELENQEEGDLEYQTQAGARITLQEAVPHIYHFCAKLSVHPTPVPAFILEEDGNFRSCTVILPSSIEPALREYSSTQLWKTEKTAKQEACYQAIVALHKAGLLNKHLLAEPSIGEGMDELYDAIEKRPSMADVAGQYDPWAYLARLWTTTLELQVYQVAVQHELRSSSFLMIVPAEIPDVSPISLYIHRDASTQVRMAHRGTTSPSSEDLMIAKQATRLILASIFGRHLHDEKMDFVALCLADGVADLGSWLRDSSGTLPCKGHLRKLATGGIIRDQARWGARYIYQETTEILDEDGVTPKTIIKAKKFRKRLDFMNPKHISPLSAQIVDLDPETCTVDKLPLEYAEFALMIPAILHVLGARFTAAAVHGGVLQAAEFSSSSLILPALSTPKASGTEDYQRLELLGDTVLKFLTSVTLMANKLSWPEGHLTKMKSSIVSNGRLAKACEDTGLAQYVLSEPFSGAKWRPSMISDLLENSQGSCPRKLSTKTLADVCEAIIGAAYLDGGFDKAIAVLQIFIPEIDWQFPLAASAILRTNALHLQTPPPAYVHQLEHLLDYTFTNPSLLIEALTHSSDTPTSQYRSYERLEFLGDAILDYIVCRTLYHSAKTLSVPRMHCLKTAAVNGSFLAYRALSTTIPQPITDLHTEPITDPTTGKPTTKTTATETHVNRCLPDFLRSGMQHTLLTNLTTTRTRFYTLQPQLAPALSTTSSTYPWSLLAAFDPDKTFSDLLESVLGAVWIDSSGDMETCERLLRTLGVMGWLEDAVERGVEVWHPKEEVGALVARLWQREVKYESFRREEEAGDRRELDDRREGRQKGKDQWVLGEGEWSCRLLVGGEVVVEVSGWNRMEVESRAAEMAVVKLRRNAGTARSELEKVVEEQVAEERLSEDMKGRNEQEGLVDDEEDVDGVTLGDPTRSEGGALLGMGLDGVMELVEGNIAMEASRKRKDRND